MHVKRLTKYLKEELLLEYNADKTWKNHGQKAIDRSHKEWSDHHSHDVLHNMWEKDHDYDLSDKSPDEYKNYLGQRGKENLLKHFEDSDPTPNKKYVQHIARIYGSGGVNHIEDISSRMTPALERYHDLSTRNQLAPEDRDIGRVKTLSHLEDIVDKHKDTESNNEVDKAYHELMKSPEHSTITDHPGFKHIVPHTKEASCHFGKGTRWCTAATGAYNYFDYYHKEGPLQILQPHHPTYPGEKYQYHYSSDSLMNEKDEPVGFGGKIPAEISHHIRNYNDGVRNAINAGWHAIKNHPEHSLASDYFNENGTHEEIMDALDHSDLKVRQAAIESANSNEDHALKASSDSDYHVRFMAVNKDYIHPEHTIKALDDDSEHIRNIASSYHLVDDKMISHALNSKYKDVRANAANQAYTHDTQSKALDDKDEIVRLEASANHRLTSENIHKALNDKDHVVRSNSLFSDNVKSEHIDKALSDKHPLVRKAVFSQNTHTLTSDHLHKALDDDDDGVRYSAINNKNVKPEHIDKALDDKNSRIRIAAINRNNATPEHIDKASKDKDPKIRRYVIASKNISDHHIEAGLNDEDHSVRTISALMATKPEHIDKALDDTHYKVRQQAILNKNSTLNHLVKGAKDKNTDVSDQAKRHISLRYGIDKMREVLKEHAWVPDDPVRWATHHHRDTKNAKVIKKYNERRRDMFHTKRTKAVIKYGFKSRAGDNLHLTDRSGRDITDRQSLDKRRRVNQIRDNTKNIGESVSNLIPESEEYIQNKKLIHDAHASASTDLAGMENDPELKRMDIHRAKKHAHTSNVLSKLLSVYKKTKK